LSVIIYLEKIRVLLTAVGHPTTPGIVNSLKNNGERDVDIIGTDSNEQNIISKLFEKKICVPTFNDPKYMSKILEICKKEKIDVYYARREEEALSSSLISKKFNKIGVKIISPASFKTLQISCNKAKFHKFFERKNIQHANYGIIKKIKDIEEVGEKLGYPKKKVIIKPSFSVGGRGTVLIDSKMKYDPNFRDTGISRFTMNQFLQLFENEKIPTELIMMEFLPGKYFSVDVLSYKGKPYYIIPKTRDSGNPSYTTMGKIELNQKVIQLAKKVCNSFKFSYLQNYEMKMNENDKPIIYDINPRGGASLSFCTAAGVNLMYFAVKLALGEKIPLNNKIKSGLIMKRAMTEYFENGR
jgi:carbamoyl-phosphate synthase large subunit